MWLYFAENICNRTRLYNILCRFILYYTRLYIYVYIHYILNIFIGLWLGCNVIENDARNTVLRRDDHLDSSPVEPSRVARVTEEAVRWAVDLHVRRRGVSCVESPCGGRPKGFCEEAHIIFEKKLPVFYRVYYKSVKTSVHFLEILLTWWIA